MHPFLRTLTGAVISAGAVLAMLSWPAALPRASARPTPPPFAIGDSVMLGARPCLERAGLRVDSLGSRQISAGLEILRSMRTSLPDQVVVHLGTNGGMHPEDLARLMRILRDVRRIVLVTIQLPENGRYTFEVRTNDAIRAVASRYKRVRIVEWNARSDRQAGLTWSDHIHVTPRGCEVYARMVVRALNEP